MRRISEGGRFCGWRLGFGWPDDTGGNEGGLAAGFVGVDAVIAHRLLAHGRDVEKGGGDFLEALAGLTAEGPARPRGRPPHRGWSPRHQPRGARQSSRLVQIQVNLGFAGAGGPCFVSSQKKDTFQDPNDTKAEQTTGLATVHGTGTFGRSTSFSPPSGPAQRLFQEFPAKSKFLAVRRAVFGVWALIAMAASGEGGNRANKLFEISFSEEGITTLKRKDDSHDTNYIASGRALGADVMVRYRPTPQQPWKPLQGKFKAYDDKGERIRLVAGASNELKVTQEFVLEDDHLDWTITVANQAEASLEIGDLAVPMVFAENVPRNRGDIYARKLIRHSFVSGHGSWIYWSRANAEGPYLVMATGQETKFEYFDNSANAFTPYIHGSVASQEPIAKAAAFGGGAKPWRFPLTTLILSPEGSEGSTATYRFKFRFAENAEAVRNVLYDENLFDVNILPGMSLPIDLSAMISLRTKIGISNVEAEFPDQTRIEYLGEKGPDNHVYRVKFAKLGENMLRVRYGDQRWMSLEFFIMEPLETVSLGQRWSPC
jgi:hypothetical protein